MAASETRAIVISNGNGGKAAGVLHVRRFSAGDRVRRALAVLGLMWLLAVLAVAIPIAHFVLVPLLLLAGPAAAWMRYRVTEQNERVTGDCPSCGAPVVIELDSSDRLPLWTYCPPSDDPIHLLEAPGGAGLRG